MVTKCHKIFLHRALLATTALLNFACELFNVIAEAQDDFHFSKGDVECT